MNSEQRQQIIQQRLTRALSPTFLEIVDESHLHVGHPGAQSGGGHFKITISSPQFAGKNQIACHQLIYTALKDLIGNEIHALQIVCR